MSNAYLKFAEVPAGHTVDTQRLRKEAAARRSTPSAQLPPSVSDPMDYKEEGPAELEREVSRKIEKSESEDALSFALGAIALLVLVFLGLGLFLF